jgi:hypothetical protein
VEETPPIEVVGAEDTVPPTELLVVSRLVVVTPELVVVTPEVEVVPDVEVTPEVDVAPDVVVAPVVVVGLTVVVVAQVVVVGFTVVVVAPDVVVVPPMVVAEASCVMLMPASTMATATSQTAFRLLTFFSCLPICLYLCSPHGGPGSRAAARQTEQPLPPAAGRPTKADRPRPGRCRHQRAPTRLASVKQR